MPLVHNRKAPDESEAERLVACSWVGVWWQVGSRWFCTVVIHAMVEQNSRNSCSEKFGLLVQTLTKFVTLIFLILIGRIALAEEMAFSHAGTGGNCNGCEWVMAQGEITTNTPAKFREYVAQHGRPYRIALHSPGGDLKAGMELGRLIRKEGATTWVAKTVSLTERGLEHLETIEAGVCASACAFAFMGGLERKVGEADLLGVHQFYSTDNQKIDPKTVQNIAGRTLLFTIQMGIDPRVIVAASQTLPDDIYWFTPAELNSFGIDTTTSSTDPWKLEPYSTGLVLTTTHHDSVRRSVSVTLFCRREDRRWRLLISEDLINHAANFPTGKLLDFSEPNRSAPKISVGTSDYMITEDLVEFQRINDGRFYLSLSLPNRVASAGGEALKFDPDLARVFNQFMTVFLVLPETGWLGATRDNCI